ncbi:ComEC/Rec2 family competence protein [Bacteroidota bacterium]
MCQLSKDLYNIGKYNTKYTFAEFPSIKIYKTSDGNKWGNHLLFGDYIKILNPIIENNRVLARSRNTKGWVNIDEIQKDRILEVNFVDIGQGDGCHIVTPEDKHIIIDAGKTDNMDRYLSWRFNLQVKKRPLSFPFTAIISHSDDDHYKGFGNVFDNDKIRIDKIYHNGLVERPGDLPLGTVDNDHITGLVKTTDQMLEIIENSNNRKGKRSTYCKTLYKVLKNNPDVEFVSLSIKDNCIKGFDENHLVNNKIFSFKILAPIPNITNGKESLKTINDLGKDKNGHSVILKVIYDKAKVLLGGDVNTEFGKIILEYYQNQNKIEELQVDAAKACHHGSNHFHYGFMKSINSSATIISSGDEESYSHPRPDAIGALGKCGYGDKPLIFSTELARSNKEFTHQKLETVSKLFNSIKKIDADLKQKTDPDIIKKLNTKRLKNNNKINSFLTKYGMINLRTDGKRMIIAQKYEVPANYGKWDVHKLVYSSATERFEQQ